jgi:hypothetical protein
LGFLLFLDMFYPVIQPAIVVGLHLDWVPLALKEPLVLLAQLDFRELPASVLRVQPEQQVLLVLSVQQDLLGLQVQLVLQAQLA